MPGKTPSFGWRALPGADKRSPDQFEIRDDRDDRDKINDFLRSKPLEPASEDTLEGLVTLTDNSAPTVTTDYEIVTAPAGLDSSPAAAKAAPEADPEPGALVSHIGLTTNSADIQRRIIDALGSAVGSENPH